jgi:hypothetical protein
VVEQSKLFEAWVDEPHRSLGGMTPREAAGHPRAWRKLEVILKVKEHAERELPEDQRFDFQSLRERLGIAGRR